MRFLVVIVFSSLTVLIISTSCSGEKTDKIAFMQNAKVFEEFDMKKDYDRRIQEDMSVETKMLDSLELHLGQVMESGDSLKAYQLRRQHYIVEQQYNQKFQDYSTRYTSEVNERLNKYIEEYSKEKGYDIILGSNGQGNVMYVKEEKDITEDLITYVNSKFNK